MKGSNKGSFCMKGSDLEGGEGASRPCPGGSLLNNIHDQQVYLALTSTLLQLATEAGAPPEAVQAVANSLRAARGPEGADSLMPLLGKEGSIQKRRESYSSLQAGMDVEEEKGLLRKLERDLLEGRERESHYLCLEKYKGEKSEEVAPTASWGAASRKQRFKRMVEKRPGALQSSNFFDFQVNQLLQNSYRYENECYRTMNSFSHLKTMFGHSSEPDIESYSQIFNAVPDRSEELIITGGEEGLIKIWHRRTGCLVRNIKGHTDYVNKIDTSPCNRYLMSSAGDGLRFYDLERLAPLGGWKTSSISEITSFLHNGLNYFLFGSNSSFLCVLTEAEMLAHSQDRLGLSNFYRFNYGDLIAKDNCPILVITISPLKTHLLIGLESGQMLIVQIEELLTAIQLNQTGQELTLPSLLPVKAHHEEIIEMKFNENNLLWATGAKDGRCCLWELKGNGPQLLTTLVVNGKPQKGRRKRHSYSCSYICWNCVNSHFAAGFQENVEEEDNDRGRGEVLVFSLSQNRVTTELSKDVSQEYGGIRAMDAHPYFPNILLICEADGHILLFDIFIGCIVNTFEERGYHVLHPQFQLIPTECHFNSDGLSFFVATEYGSLSLYGYDQKTFFAGSPVEQFLENDFAKFILDDRSLRPLPADETLPREDINLAPQGLLRNIRMEAHPHSIQIDPLLLLQCLRGGTQVGCHLPQIEVDAYFMEKCDHNLRENERQEELYWKTFEEIERMKQLVLFHERERQYLAVSNIISEKLKALKQLRDKKNGISGSAQEEEENENEILRRPVRKLKRHSQNRRVNYVDDFQYHDSQEEDYNAESALHQDFPDFQQLSLSDVIDEDSDEPVRLRDRTNRACRRSTRNNNNNSSNNYNNYNNSNNHSNNSNQLRHSSNRMSSEMEDDDGPEMMSRRRRRDPFEWQELENDYVVKKKVKMDEDEDQERHYSRLKKQIRQNSLEEEEEEATLCYRCEISNAVVICKHCEFTQQFCQNCSRLRGKRVSNDKFVCLICLFLKNHAQEERLHLTEDPYRQTFRKSDPFLPQQDDQVRFFFQGYEEFLVQNVNRLNNQVYRQNQAFRLLPHTENPELLNTPLCQVVSLDYYFPLKLDTFPSVKRTPGKVEKSPIQMLLELRIVGSKDVFWVYYWPGQEFLVPEEVYSYVVSEDLLSRLRVNELVNLKEEELQIVQLGPLEDRFPESIWRGIKVRKTEGKRLRGNTKDIEKRMNIWKLGAAVAMESSLSEEMRIRGIEQLQLLLAQKDSPFCIFNDYVDFDIYPDYRKQIPIGMCMEAILARLTNHYYRGPRSFEHDVSLLLTNSQTFNGPHHHISKTALELTSLLLPPSHAPHPDPIKEQPPDSQAVKKERRNLEGEEESLLRTRRKEEAQGMQLNTRRRRRQSSDYEEESSNNEREMRGVETRARGTRTGVSSLGEPRRLTRSGNRNP